MTDPPPQSILCPVCRARQPLQRECRRCGANLDLYCQALTAVSVAKGRCTEAQRRGDDRALEAGLAYLRWLSPREAAQWSRSNESGPDSSNAPQPKDSDLDNWK